ncbi:ABC transporter permease subunit [Ruminococcus sp.]|uniref:ABC transporter permease subunit n=1 Tax=Ruminococcus sp. TaxID=41978 RepID=UPI0025FCC318|nr:ABC transporter permease subunit [Ruminococcus sp.]MBQ8967800.1 ABC transporter permease subunit [Ruminococcus sp.]
MINLLSVGYSKLFKNLAFRVCLIIMAALPMFLTAVSVSKTAPGSGPLNGIYNTGMIFIGLLIGAFVSVYISQDHSEKTLNNKIMAGYSRAVIYLADFIVTVSGALMMQLMCILASSLIAVPARGMYTEPFADAVKQQFILFCVVAVYTALVLLICTVINSKAHAVAVSLMAVMVMLIAGISVYDMTVRKGEAPAASTEVTTEDKVVKTLYNVLPQSQMYAVMEEHIPADAAKMICYDAAAIAVMTAAGIVIFKKKDIK